MTILTTHVGSLPRNQEVVDFIFAREHGTPYDAPAFDAAMTRAVTVFAAGATSASLRPGWGKLSAGERACPMARCAGFDACGFCAIDEHRRSPRNAAIGQRSRSQTPALNQRRSMMVTFACPPPSHIVCRP